MTRKKLTHSQVLPIPIV